MFQIWYMLRLKCWFEVPTMILCRTVKPPSGCYRKRTCASPWRWNTTHWLHATQSVSRSQPVHGSFRDLTSSAANARTPLITFLKESPLEPAVSRCIRSTSGFPEDQLWWLNERTERRERATPECRAADNRRGITRAQQQTAWQEDSCNRWSCSELLL